MKVKKKFDYNGITLQIIERDEPYMNSTEPMKMTRVIAPNGGVIPVNLKHKQTLKSIVSDTTALLDSFKERGADVVKELTQKLT